MENLSMRTLSMVFVALAHLYFALGNNDYRYSKKITTIIWLLITLFLIFDSYFSPFPMWVCFIYDFSLIIIFYLITMKGSTMKKLFYIFNYVIHFTYITGLFRIPMMLIENDGIFVVLLFDVLYFLTMLFTIKHLLPKFNGVINTVKTGWNKLWLFSTIFFILLFIQFRIPKYVSTNNYGSIVIFILSGACYLFCFNLMCINLSGLVKYNEELEITNSLTNLAYIDELTTLSNKAALDKYLEYLKNNYDKEANIRFIMLDADKFKEINDTYGHAKGDEVLHQIGVTIKEVFKEKNYNLFRIGGDEFVLIATNTKFEEIKTKIKELNHRLKKINGIRMSSGIASVRKENVNDPFGTALKHADKKMYQDKFSR